MKKEQIDNSLANFIEACKKNGLKVTPQRIEIYKELIKLNDHPSATEIYQRVKKKFPHISFDTVNRTLQKLVEMGVARLVEDYEDIKRYDGIMERHHHFHCLKCHRIIDVYDKRLEEINIPDVVAKRFTVVDTKIVFAGICDQCKK